MAKRATRGKYHGFLVIEKPAGITSHDVVGRVRRLTGERRVGHAGTLDPAAVGVLPVAVGQATRTVEYLSDASKSYLADITFGVTTDSADGDGTVTDVRPAVDVTEEIVRDALVEFHGEILQVPPMHSAIKIDGRPLYELARRGEVLDLDPRPVTIHEIELIDWDPPVAQVFVHCSKGTYIRSLARDLGDAVGTGAYMSHLVRLSTGPFSLDDAWTLSELETELEAGHWEDVAVHADAAVAHRPALILTEDAANSWKNGNAIGLRTSPGIVRVYDSHGHWLGVGMSEPDNERVKPEKVVTEAYEN